MAQGLELQPQHPDGIQGRCLQLELDQTGNDDAVAAPARAPAAAAGAAAADAPAPARRKDTRSALAKRLGWGSPKRRKKNARSAKGRTATSAPKSAIRSRPKELSPEEQLKAAAKQREREDAAIARALQAQLGGGCVHTSAPMFSTFVKLAAHLGVPVCAECTVDASRANRRSSIQWPKLPGRSWHTQTSVCLYRAVNPAARERLVAVRILYAATSAPRGTRSTTPASQLLRRTH